MDNDVELSNGEKKFLGLIANASAWPSQPDSKTNS